MNKTLLFKEVETIGDFKDIIEENIDYISHTTSAFINQESLEVALQGLKEFPKDQEKNFISFVKRVDKAYASRGTANGNAFHKFPIVIAGVIFYGYYPETIAKLTLDEIVLLSCFSFVEPPDFYETAAEKYGKELLSTIIEKTGNHNNENLSIFMWADKLMREDNKTKEEIIAAEEKYSAEMFKNIRLSW